MREVGGPSFVAYGCDRAEAIVRSLINNIIGFLFNRENSLIGFTKVIPANKIKKRVPETFLRKPVLPSNHLYEGQVISQGHKLLPAKINKPIATTLKPVLVVEMCAK